MDSIVESTACFTVLTNFIASDSRSHMVVTFILVPVHRQAQCEAIDRKRGHTTIQKFQEQSKA